MRAAPTLRRTEATPCRQVATATRSPPTATRSPRARAGERGAGPPGERHRAPACGRAGARPDRPGGDRAGARGSRTAAGRGARAAGARRGRRADEADGTPAATAWPGGTGSFRSRRHRRWSTEGGWSSPPATSNSSPSCAGPARRAGSTPRSPSTRAGSRCGRWARTAAPPASRRRAARCCWHRPPATARGLDRGTAAARAAARSGRALPSAAPPPAGVLGAGEALVAEQGTGRAAVAAYDAGDRTGAFVAAIGPAVESAIATLGR